MTEAKKIIIIDDDRDYVNALEVILGSGGYQVDHAYNIIDGYKAIDGNKPDLIILDVMMERHTDGFDFCYKLKHDEKLKSIPVMMVTAVTDKTGFKFSPETDGEYLEADDYVKKPIPVAELLSRVTKLLNKA